jgi:hypothetical protein
MAIEKRTDKRLLFNRADGSLGSIKLCMRAVIRSGVVPLGYQGCEY